MIIKAKVTKAFNGQPDDAFRPRVIAVGEVISGDLARVALENDWADEHKGPGRPPKKKAAKKAAKK